MQQSAAGQHAGPPLLRRPQTSLSKRNKQRRGTTRGYIYGVAPNNVQPTTCSVVIDNNPPVPGFSLPSGTGPIFPQGTDTYQGRFFNGPWLVNPDTLQGGSPCIIDLDTMSVVQIMHSTGGTAPDGTAVNGYTPSTGELLVGTHNHTGVLDSDGHINPQPVSMDDEVADGVNFARVATSEMDGNTVKQLNDGTHVRTAAQLAGAIDENSNLLGNPFGNTSGVVYSNANDSLSGFSASGVGTSTTASYPCSQCLVVSADILGGTPTGNLQLMVGTTTAGYAMVVSNPGNVFTLQVFRYSGGTATQIGTTSTNGSVADFTQQIVRLRIAVDFSQHYVEAAADTCGSSGMNIVYSTVISEGSNWPTFSPSAAISINAGGTTGQVNNLIINHRDLYLDSNIAYQGVVNPPGSAHPLAAGVVDTQAIQNYAVTSVSTGCAIGSSGPAIYAGPSAPTLSANTGSLFLSSAGHAYINTSGGGSGTTWTLII